MAVFSYSQGSVAGMGTGTGTGPIGSSGYGVSLRGYEPITTVTATKTLAMVDSGTVQNCINAASAVIIIPLNSAEPFPIGAKVIIRKTTAQTVTVAWSTGVTVLNSLGTTLTVTSVTSTTIIRKTDVDVWIAFPDLPETAIGGALRTAVDSTSAKSTIGLALVNNVPLAEPRAAGIQIGTGAGLGNTTATGWTAIGNLAGFSNTIGGNWTAIGSIAGYNSTTGGNWTAIGYFAGFSNTTGNTWTAIGYGAGSSNTTGNNWTAIGDNAGADVTTGSYNTMIGSNAGRGITTGSGNTVIGAGVTGLASTLVNTVIIASGDGISKIFSDSTGLKVGVNSSDSRIKLTSPNGTVYAFAVNDSGVLFKV